MSVYVEHWSVQGFLTKSRLIVAHFWSKSCLKGVFQWCFIFLHFDKNCATNFQLWVCNCLQILKINYSLLIVIVYFKSLSWNIYWTLIPIFSALSSWLLCKILTSASAFIFLSQDIRFPTLGYETHYHTIIYSPSFTIMKTLCFFALLIWIICFSTSFAPVKYYFDHCTQTK